MVSEKADWFADLTGFRESRDGVYRHLDYDSRTGMLYSRVNGRTMQAGKLAVVSLAGLRQQVDALTMTPGRSRLSECVADVVTLHEDVTNRGALFQAASQFNLLEMPDSSVVPEDGVTGYRGDPTQGPACAIACGAGTIVRNYFVEVDGLPGQSAQRQIDCLAGVGEALENDRHHYWRMQNGYALFEPAGAQALSRRLQGQADEARDELRARLCIGLMQDTEVTRADPPFCVTQAYCSALALGMYSQVDTDDVEVFARLVLEASYEATLLAVVLNRQRTGCNRVFLTLVGGGVFGNHEAWIIDAIERAFCIVRHHDLDVVINSYRQPLAAVSPLLEKYREA